MGPPANWENKDRRARTIFRRKIENRSLDKAVRHDETAREIIVDPVTTLEGLFALPATVGFLMVMLSGLYLFLWKFKVVDGEAAGVSWMLFIGGLVLVPLGVMVGSLIDDHYRLDLDEGSVYFCRRLFDRESMRRTCGFSEVSKLSIDHTSTRVRVGTSPETYEDQYTYGLKMSLKNGRSIRLIDRTYSEFDLVREKARMLADHLGVEVTGERGLPNRSGTSVTTKGCLQTIGVLLVLFFIALVSTQFERPKSQRPQPKATPQTSPEKLRPSQKLLVQLLEDESLEWQADFYDKGLVEISTTPALWKAICGDGPSATELLSALSAAPEVVKEMGTQLKLPEKPMNRRAYPHWWKDKVTLKISMEFQPEESSLPILARNLGLALKRLKMVQPRDGEAHLNLMVFQEADKPKVMPEKHGVTLVIPADKPIDPADLGLEI